MANIEIYCTNIFYQAIYNLTKQNSVYFGNISKVSVFSPCRGVLLGNFPFSLCSGYLDKVVGRSDVGDRFLSSDMQPELIVFEYRPTQCIGMVFFCFFSL